MNRRNFLKIFGLASVGATVAYSFPSIIVPKNIIIPDFIPANLNNFLIKTVDDPLCGFGFSGFTMDSTSIAATSNWWYNQFLQQHVLPKNKSLVL